MVDKILSHITFEDMKSFAAATLSCLQNVRRNKAFISNAKLIVGPDTPLDMLSGIFGEWRYLSVDLSVNTEVLEHISHILPSVISVCLKGQPGNNLPQPNAIEHLSQMFKRTPNLKTLKLDGLAIPIIQASSADEEVQTGFSKISDLAIVSFMDKPAAKFGLGDLEDPYVDIENLLHLSKIPMKLSSFAFGKFRFDGKSITDHVQFIPRIVNASKDTLQELELHLAVWKLGTMRNIRCPKLKRLVATVYNDYGDSDIFREFLRMQPPLTELEVSMSKDYAEHILPIIAEMKTTLKKLHLTVKSLTGSTSPMEWEWDFLSSMTELRDFRIKRPFTYHSGRMSWEGYGDFFLSKLPPGVRKVGITLKPGFDTFDFGSRKEEDVRLMLSRLTNLTEINLMGTTGAVTDTSIQTIIKTFPKLKSLAFSNCSVSNVGLQGFREQADSTMETFGESITSLKGKFYVQGQVVYQCVNPLKPYCSFRYLINR